MQSKRKIVQRIDRKSTKNTRFFKFMILFLLLLGVIFRFTNLDKKPFWGDETYSAIRINGHHDVNQKKYDLKNRILTKDDVLQFQKPDPTKDLKDTITALKNSLEHPPLFYLLAKGWVSIFGSSVWAMRSLSTFFSLLLFPAIYWLSRELFAQEKYPWLPEIAISLTAISPIFIRYAQEFREYALWSAAICICSASLLRAIKRNRFIDWCIYTFAASFSLYTCLLSVLMLVAHGIYLVLINKKLISKYLLTSAIAFLSFSPWIRLLVIDWNATVKSVSWMNYPIPFIKLIQIWLENISHILFSLSIRNNISVIEFILCLGCIFILLYSLYFCVKTTRKQTWIFLIILISINALFFLIPDIVTGGQKTRNPQYFFPCYIGFILSVSYIVCQKLLFSQAKLLWYFLVSIYLILIINSCTLSSQASTWWRLSEFEVKSAEIINTSTEPLVISNSFGMLISLAHEVKPQTKFFYYSEEAEISKLCSESNRSNTHIYIYTSSDQWLKVLESKKYNLKLVYKFKENRLEIKLYSLCI